MLIDLFAAFLAVVLLVPFLTGYAGYTHGRSFWLWFTLGLVLPVVSLGVLTILLAIRRLDKGARLVDEARQILADAEEKERRQPERWEW